jgi:hypothetical protein
VRTFGGRSLNADGSIRISHVNSSSSGIKRERERGREREREDKEGGEREDERFGEERE